MSRLANAVYRGVARAVAVAVARLGFVRSVYARRSVACGEAVLPRSDLDLTVIVDPARDLEQEVARMRALARRLRALRRLVPVLGPAEVATPEEIDLWYRAPCFPGSAERDRGWLRLWGDEVVRPECDAPAGDAWRQNLPWFFWAWQALPSYLRARRVRTCCNLVLDMLNVALLAEGAVRGPVARTALVETWAQRLGEVPELAPLRAALRGRGPADPDGLLRWLYRQSVGLAHGLNEGPSADALSLPHRLESRVPFAYEPRVHILVEPDEARGIEVALDEMLSTPRAIVGSARTLARYLRERNPWEWWCIDDAAARAALARPDDAAMLRAIRYYLHRTPLRRLGLAIGTGVDRRDTIGPQYAQARLWLDHREVAAGREELRAAWRRAYGDWLYPAVATADDFFAHVYPIACREIEELAPRVGIGAASVTPRSPARRDEPRGRADFA